MTKAQIKPEVKDRLLAVALFITGVAYYLSYFNYNLRLLDEGYLLDPVMRVMSGQIPYRDFHHYYSPGSFYLFAVLFKVTGADTGVVRIFWALLHSVTAIIAYLVARRFVSPAFAFASALMFIAAPGPWHKSFFVCLPFFCLWSYLKYYEKRSQLWLFLSAFASVAAFFFRQDVGVYGGIVFIAVLLAFRGAVVDRPLRVALLFALWSVILALPVLAYFYAHHALGDFFEDVLFAGFKGTKAMDFPFPAFFPLYSGSIMSTLRDKLFYLPFVVYTLGVLLLVFKWGSLKKKGMTVPMTALLLFGMLLLLQLKNRTDSAHLWQVMPFVYVMSAILCYVPFAVSGKSALAGMAVLGSVMAVILSVALTDPASGSIALKSGCDTLLDLPRAKIYLPHDRVAEIKGAVKFIQENSPENSYVLALPDCPVLYFLADRKNPICFEALLLGTGSEVDEQQRVIREIESSDVDIAVLHANEVDNFIPERRFVNHSPIVYSYLRSHYREAGREGSFIFLKKR